MKNEHFMLVVLLAIQSKELREKCRDLEEQVKELEPYHSPLWDKLHKEPDPLKQQEIRAQIQADQERDAQLKAKKKQDIYEFIARLGSTYPIRKWEIRDKKHVPYQAVFWHEPMTVNDYHNATGMSARQLRNVLHRLNAEPLQDKSTRKRRNEPLRYGVETNLKVFCEWLIRYQKDLEVRRAWLVKTCLKYKHEKREHFQSFLDAIMPVLKSLDLNSGDALEQFIKYHHEVDRLLYPPPPAFSMDMPGISALAALNSIAQ